MTRILLMRGMPAELVAGPLVSGSERWIGQPRVERAIAFEEAIEQAKGHTCAPEAEQRAARRASRLPAATAVEAAAVARVCALVVACACGRHPLSNRPCWILLLLIAYVLTLSAQPKPQRIVSTAPSITETLFALGLGDKVVGVSQFCNYPPEVRKLPKVGSYIRPDSEAIARLAPDLVVLERESTSLAERLTALHIASVLV